jgi:hypothetical protein
MGWVFKGIQLDILSPNTDSGVDMIVNSVVSPKSIYITLDNKSDKKYTYGSDFALYVYKNDSWEEVQPIIDSWGFNEEGYYLLPHSETEEIFIDWSWLYGELPDGDYLIRKSLLLVRNPGDVDKYLLESEFSISIDSGEYLQITTLSYANGENDNDGLILVLYLYSIKDNSLTEILRTPSDAEYPVAFADFEKNSIFFSDCANGDNWDNMFAYDMRSKSITQLTFGKFLFNDLFMADKNLVSTVAPQYKIAIQPAIFHHETQEFQYLNPDDDDTLCFSLSYNYVTKQILILTCSNAEMRTLKVIKETHIRPKTLHLMNEDFSDYRPIYTTDQFEICFARQLDANRILMTIETSMISMEPRKLKVLYLDSLEIDDFDIPGIIEITSFYPTYDTTGIYFTGRDMNNFFGLFHYDLNKQELTEIFEKHKPVDYRNLMDFVYYVE